MNIVLTQTPPPPRFDSYRPVNLTEKTMEEHRRKVLTKMEEARLDALVLYADREHGSNFAYLTGFEPRFEEAALVLHRKGESFLLLGSALSFVVGLVGVLNYINAVLTGIITRKRELAMLQSIGMTGAQLKRMLQYEGLLYALGAVGLALVLALAAGPLLADVMEGMFWFFSYHLTLWPILILLPVFALLGIAVPSLVYRSLSRSTIVERLRDGET